MVKLSVCIEMVFTDHPFEERIERVGATGAHAVEFWGWRDEDLAAVHAACEEWDADLAAMLGSGAPLTEPGGTSAAVRDLEESIEVASDLGCPNLIVTVGLDQDDVARDAQHEAIVEALRQVAPAAESAGVTLGIEPLNTTIDHPDYYLSSSEEGREIVTAVDSPAVGLLFDVYHQQITEGDVTRNLTDAIADLSYVHVADNTGRHEPGTGELDYGNVLSALLDEGYDGYVGCEFHSLGDDDAAVDHCLDLLKA